jgi:hypothetical protein
MSFLKENIFSKPNVQKCHTLKYDKKYDKKTLHQMCKNVILYLHSNFTLFTNIKTL